MANVKKITTLKKDGRFYILVTENNAQVEIPEEYQKIGKTFMGDFSKVKNPSDPKFIYQ